MITEVPFSVENGYLIVQAKIKNEMPVDVILSTGADYSTIDWELLYKYGFEGGIRYEPPVTGGPLDRSYHFSTVPDVRLGESKARTLEMRFGSLSRASSSIGREIFGILGADFFKRRIVRFDFKKGILRFLNQSPAVDPAALKTGMDSNGRIIFRMIGRHGRYKSLTVPLVENVSIDGRKVKALLDTGANFTVGLSSSAAKKLEFIVPGNKGGSRIDNISSLRLATHELTDVPVLISAKGTKLESELTEEGVVVGIGILQHFSITFDFSKEIVLLERL